MPSKTPKTSHNQNPKCLCCDQEIDADAKVHLCLHCFRRISINSGNTALLWCRLHHTTFDPTKVTK